MNTHETYVSLETAKILKKAGFDWEIDSLYQVYPEEPVRFEVDSKFQYNWNIHSNIISAPTLAVAQKWLREIKGYAVYPTRGGYKIYVLDENDSAGFSNTYVLNSTLSYDAAIEAGIKVCLDLILKEK